MRNRMKLSIVALVSIVVVYLVSLVARISESDVNPTTLTLSRLDTIGLIMMAMHDKGVEFTKFNTLDEWLRKAHEQKMITDEDVATKKFAQDAWKKPLIWERQSNSESTVISVISRGGDSGSDLSLILTIPREGEPYYALKK